MSREGSTKKTPCGKNTNEISQGDKVLDLVLNTMSTFTDKLSAMEAQISGLLSRMDSSTGVTPACKSHSREKSKCSELVDTSDDHSSLFAMSVPTCSSENIPTFTQTFPDTVVTFKPTPARAKKPKPDIDLGVTPLDTSVQKTLDYKFGSAASHLPKPSATVSKTPVGTSTEWEHPLPGLSTTTSSECKPKAGRDENQNF